MKYDPYRELIKEYRIRRGMSQKKLGDTVGVTQTFISELESGRKNPSLETYRKIFIALEIESEKLELISRTILELDADNGKIAEYYHDEETRTIVQEIYERPDLRALFRASRKTTPEEVNKIIQMIQIMNGESDESS